MEVPTSRKGQDCYHKFNSESCLNHTCEAHKRDFIYLLPFNAPVCIHRYMKAFGGNNVIPTRYTKHASYTHVPSRIKGLSILHQEGKAASRTFFDVLSEI